MSTPEFGQPGANGTPLSDAEWQASLPSFGEPVRSFAAPAVSPPPPAAAIAPVASTFGSIPPLGSTSAPGGPIAPTFGAPASAFGSIPRTMTAPQGMYRDWAPQPTSASTPAVWLLIALPLILAGIQWVLLFLVIGPDLVSFFLQISEYPTAAPTAALIPWYLANMALSLAYFVVTIWVGFRDHAALLRLGHRQSASPWWLVLNPLIYLIIRRHHVRPAPGATSPVVTWVVLYIAPWLAVVILFFVLLAAVPVR